MKVKLLGGEIQVPIRSSSFGEWLDLGSAIPRDCDTIMVMLNSGGGLNAGFPKPIGFVKLTGQLYLADLEKLLENQAKQSTGDGFPMSATRWVTIAPMRSKEFVDVWTRGEGQS